MDQTYFEVIDSPVGKLLLAARSHGLTTVLFEPHEPSALADWQPNNGTDAGASAMLAVARDQLAAYFAGDLTNFDLPRSPTGTSFQLRVWDELRRIPFGELTSYGELARRLGVPNSAR